jgi:hypothetical protein
MNFYLILSITSIVGSLLLMIPIGAFCAMSFVATNRTPLTILKIYSTWIGLLGNSLLLIMGIGMLLSYFWGNEASVQIWFNRMVYFVFYPSIAIVLCIMLVRLSFIQK